MHVNISHLLPFLFLLPNLKIVILLFPFTTEFVQEFSNIDHLSAINMTAFYRSQGFAFIFKVMTE